MALAALADLAEVVSAFGVIASLIFVGVQLRQNTRQMRRGESNAAMAQGSAMRHLMISDRDVAALFLSGIGGAPLDPVDEMRMNAFFSEITYMTIHVWDRTKNGFAPPDEFTRILAVMTPLITSARGVAWWSRMRATLRPDFVAELEGLLPSLRRQSAPEAVPSVKAAEPVETAVAPPANTR